MDDPFMFDLATLRNPRTSFSYVNYLLARKRLIEFANSDRLNPLREEFDDYMKWCAEQFKEEVRYSSEVINVIPEQENQLVKSWKIMVRNGTGQPYAIRAKNLIAPSPPRQKSLPAEPLSTVDFLSGQRIMSMNEYSARRNELRGASEPRLNVAVVGSGRRMKEILDDLLTCPRLGNITVMTEDESLTPLLTLHEQSATTPQLCSIWSKPTQIQKPAVTEASEIVQDIYMRAYEKQVQSKGQYRLRIILGRDAGAACSKSNVIIRDAVVDSWVESTLLHSIDALALGCRQMGDSLEAVQFRRGAVAEDCRLWLVSSKSEGGRALAKDIALSGGEIVRQLSSAAEKPREDVVHVQARM